MTVRHAHGHPERSRRVTRFEARITAFSDRFLTERTFELIVAPALADLQFDTTTTPLGRTRNYLAVVRAVFGGLHDELSRDSASFLVLAALPASYYIAMLTVFWDFFMKNGGSGVSVVVVLIAVLSFGPVMACFWPERLAHRSPGEGGRRSHPID